MCGIFRAEAQQRIKDTLVVNDDSMSDIIRYSARDSIYNDVKNKRVHLFGEAKLQMEDINMTAGYILVDLNANEIMASYALDKDSNRVELPTFTDGNETITCYKLRYNLDTKKGYMEELAIKQQEFYFHMGTAKRHPNDEIHLTQGRITTCDLDEPHYHFQMAKGVVIPNERIVAGPMNLWVNGIPTPFGLPFALIPTNSKKERTNGILFPEFVPISQYGFGFQNLGYYLPINDNLQTSIYANLYSRGSWGLRNDLDYAKRYGFSGRLSVGFQQFRSGFPTNSNQNKISVSWSHRKEPKSNPYWNFSSSVNFISDNNSKNSLDPINPQYFNNSFNSDININRLFPGKPLTMGMKLSMRQNSLAHNFALVSPIFNANLTRVFPFKNVFKKSTKEWAKTIQRIGFTYNMEGQNKSSFGDTLLTQGKFKEIGNQFMNGIYQNMTLQTTFALLKNTVKINPNLNYGNKINFQQIGKTYNAATNSTLIDTLSRFGMAHEFNMNFSVTTILYSYYQFIGKNQPKLRHLMTPTIGYRYVPKLNELTVANVGVNQAQITYSPYERSIYNVGNLQQASQLTFGINNTFELKFKSEKDTVTGYKKVRLVDQLSINGNYDFMKDSMRLSNLNLNLRMSPKDWLNFVSSATFSPYAWDLATGKTTGKYAVQNQQGLGRFLSTSLTTSLMIAPSKDRKKVQETVQKVNNSNWNSDYTYFALHPEQALYFDIPWKVNFSHVYTIAANQSISSFQPKSYLFVQTLVVNGDLSFTKRWKMAANMNFDLQKMQLTNFNISLNRDLHCWALSFYWTPIGGNKSFLLSIRNTSSIFKDAKFELRKPPSFL